MKKSEIDSIKEYLSEYSKDELVDLFDTYRRYCELPFSNDKEAYEGFYYLNKDDIRFAEQAIEAETGTNIRQSFIRAYEGESFINAHNRSTSVLDFFYEELADRTREVVDKYSEMKSAQSRQQQTLADTTKENTMNTMYDNYKKIKEQHLGSILFFRVGDFYEAFGVDAIKASEALDLILTTRNLDGERVSICGVPYHSIEVYKQRLENHGHQVILSDQKAQQNEQADPYSKQEIDKLKQEIESVKQRMKEGKIDRDEEDILLQIGVAEQILDARIKEYQRRQRQEVRSQLDEHSQAGDALEQRYYSHSEVVQLARNKEITYPSIINTNEVWTQEQLEMELEALQRNYIDASKLIRNLYNGASIDERHRRLYAKWLSNIKVSPKLYMIKSQVEGWPDWSTKGLPEKVKAAAEWLIENGFENDDKVKAAFYDRQTSGMSDDPRAEEMDNKAIIDIAIEKGMRATSKTDAIISREPRDMIKNNGGRDRKGARAMNSNVTVIGKVVRGIETTEVSSGATVGKFDIVVPSGKKNESGKGVGDNYFTVETWSAAEQENHKKYLKVGELVAVKGNLDVQIYDLRDDAGKGSKMTIKNPSVTYIGGQSSNAGLATIAVNGNLTRDPEVNEYENGKTKAAFTVAANNPMANDEVNFYTVELWNERAKVANYLAKGSKVNVFGNLKYETYEHNGKKGVSVKIVDPEVNFLDKKREGVAVEPLKDNSAATKAKQDQEENLPF